MFVGYAGLWSAKNSLRKICCLKNNLPQQINFAGIVCQRHISENNVSQSIYAKLINVGNTIIAYDMNLNYQTKKNPQENKGQILPVLVNSHHKGN